MRKIGILCIAFIMALSITGCWSRKELNELAVTIGLGIDKTEKGYRITAQVVAPRQAGSSSGAGSPPALIMSTEEKTVMEALRKMTTKLPRKIYLSHLSILLIDEAIARDGVLNALDFVFRDHEVRPNFDVVIVRNGSAQDALSILTPLEQMPARDMFDSLNESEKVWAPTAAVTLLDLMKWFNTEGQQAVITGLKLVGDVEKGKGKDNIAVLDSPAKFEYSGIGVMKDQVLVGWLNDSDSKAYNYVTGKVKSTVGKVECPDKEGQFVMELVHSETKIIPLIRNEKPAASVEISVEANIAEVECKLNLNDRKVLEQVKELSGQKTKELIDHGIKEVQHRYASDIFGFGQKFHQKYPKQWKKWRQEWDHYFSEMDVEVTVKYEIKGRGRIVNPIQKGLVE
ncbi:Ger(x)C family spore germination protein [Paenibacillus typhae]|uniref:Spore germination protein KC n=1 Tax=Paenibacillus typhae TaxID=1174501 RepID=A0A1G8GMD4_9BACL|nr:Ger(x)C family spore germination protein [Paenibacillus typhae]SDH95481.1 spore germination protein KC [Paenibacillus typhae]